MKRIAPSERMEQQISEAMKVSRDPLGEAARRGAQLILQRALEAEVDAFLERGRYERASDGALRGYRNGYEPKHVHLYPPVIAGCPDTGVCFLVFTQWSVMDGFCFSRNG